MTALPLRQTNTCSLGFTQYEPGLRTAPSTIFRTLLCFEFLNPVILEAYGTLDFPSGSKYANMKYTPYTITSVPNTETSDGGDAQICDIYTHIYTYIYIHIQLCVYIYICM